MREIHPGANIRAERARRNISQEEMAKQIGISREAYRLKENNSRDFSVEEFVRIADVLQVDPEILLIKSS